MARLLFSWKVDPHLTYLGKEWLQPPQAGVQLHRRLQRQREDPRPIKAPVRQLAIRRDPRTAWGRQAERRQIAPPACPLNASPQPTTPSTV
ncbi:MAG: hypothetical protein PHS96_05825 [Anaerolineales bacterium]|nr:hypothetical protein [Anaerolineales bacterium]